MQTKVNVKRFVFLADFPDEMLCTSKPVAIHYPKVYVLMEFVSSDPACFKTLRFLKVIFS